MRLRSKKSKLATSARRNEREIKERTDGHTDKHSVPTVEVRQFAHRRIPSKRFFLRVVVTRNSTFVRITSTTTLVGVKTYRMTVKTKGGKM